MSLYLLHCSTYLAKLDVQEKADSDQHSHPITKERVTLKIWIHANIHLDIDI